MVRHKSFNAWFVDSLEDFARMHRELDDAKRGLKDAEEARQRCFERQPRGSGDKLLRGKIKYAILRYRAESERERLWLFVDKCKSCVRLQRERIVQAWQRHADRAAKRYALESGEERHRIMRDSTYLGFVYEAAEKALRLRLRGF